MGTPDARRAYPAPPGVAGHFGVDVGLGREFIESPGEYRERTGLRRRIHRLAEIVDRYERRRSS